MRRAALLYGVPALFACGDGGSSPDAGGEIVEDACICIGVDASPVDGGGPEIDGGVTPRTDAEPAPTAGTIAMTLTADMGAADGDVVSLGVPFPPGALADPALVRVRDAGGAEVAAYSASLATWPGDASQRAVLLAFRATLASGDSEEWTVEYGAPRGEDAGALAAAPDGPVAAILDPAWYATSRVIGFQIPLAGNVDFAAWETEIEAYLADMDPPWESYGLDCDSTSNERTYYDGPHALYQRFIHRATLAAYRRARLEAVWYRDNELAWYDGGSVALYVCQGGWDPTEPLDWGVMRRMLGQGMLDDYLLTGDPDARAAVLGIGQAFVEDLDALTTGGEITVKVTERNMAWPMMGLASMYAVEHRADVLDALTTLVDMTIAWQDEGASGAFEHDIVRPDPDECGDGPNGGSPFMTSLLIDGLMDAYFMTADDRIPGVVVRTAEWYRDDARTSDGIAFMYLWGCNDVDYDSGDYADLNLLISHVFGAAYYVSGDEAWRDFGDTMAQHGVDNIYAGRPKQWNQSTRSFLKYLGYRAH